MKGVSTARRSASRRRSTTGAVIRKPLCSSKAAPNTPQLKGVVIYARAEIIEDLDTAIDTLVKINTRGTTVDAAQRQALTAAVSKTAAKRAVIKFHPERYVSPGITRSLAGVIEDSELRITAAVGSCWFGHARAIPGRSAGDIPGAGWPSPTRPHIRLDRVSVARSKVALNARIARVHPSLKNEGVDCRMWKVTADRCGGASGAMDGHGQSDQGRLERPRSTDQPSPTP